ncbi:MAG TPA: sulfatase-like hydrolase/transferase [Bacteroidales bacterium]|mgnify:CR=1 FL=1|nr:sulfatase-like hydrolase/transferase [Bacteroidales bacterium]HQG36662.1 sulfatase-like hydrolase/transferase [Bacteroidales bacterium]HQJ21656.1 sulfatase-like hydrolase/transferase [Bacteroidales bacterium]
MKLSKTANIIGLSFFIAGQSCQNTGKAPTWKGKPNLLFIWTDEQQFNTMRVYGNNIIKTPNLDRLAEESFVFKYAYVTQPLSTPSRSSVMTGLYPHTSGCISNNIPLPDSIECLPGLIKDQEYSTGYMGKWHLGDEIFPQKGFSTWVSIEDNYIDYYSEGRDKNMRSSYHNWLIEKGYKPDTKDNRFSRDFASRLPIEHCKPRFLEEKACEFLEQNKKNPFILYINFLEPHMPFQGPLNDMYDPGEVVLPENFDDPLEDNEPLNYKLKAENVRKTYGTTESEFRQLIARYWGLVSQVDISVGKILNKLNELGLEDNTIVVFTSDHGDMMGAHRLVAKSVMYQEAIRVPLMIKIPAMKTKHRVIENPVSQIDVLPTILDLMNAEIDNKKLHGKSLLPLISGKKANWDYVFIEWNSNRDLDYSSLPKSRIAPVEEIFKAEKSNTRTVISPDGWKLCLSELDNSQLFNLNSDPWEKINIFTEPEFRGKIIFLANKIYEWQKLTGDTLKLPMVSTLK